MADSVKITNAQRYLDLTGLGKFWTKVKEYVDGQDNAVLTLAKKHADDLDTATRTYIASLTINGQTVPESKDLTFVLEGEDIKVRVDGTAAAEGEKYADGVFSVRSAFADVDSRLDTVEAIVTENIVNDLAVVDAPSGSGTKNFVDAKIEFTGSAATGNRKGTITIDETALDAEIATINEKIVDLQANAGVTNIGVKDVDGDTTNLVSIKLTGTKASTLPENAPADWDAEANGSWAEYKANFEAKSRGDVLITLDETELEDRLDAADAKLAGEIADRKLDVANLAGSGYVVSADGKAEGDWKKTGGAYDVKYRNITDLSERLAAIDADLVTKVEEGASVENYVTLTVAKGADSGDKAVTLTLNDTVLTEKIAAMDARDAHNEAELAKVSINGKTPITVSNDGKLAGAGVTLTTEDIDRPNGAELEVTLAGYDAKLAALASATHFRGVYDDLDDAAAAVVEQGDVVIVGSKEYVYYDKNVNVDGDFAADYTPSAANFVELGDTTQEQAQITEIETWINTPITESDIDKLGWTPAITA